MPSELTSKELSTNTSRLEDWSAKPQPSDDTTRYIARTVVPDSLPPSGPAGGDLDGNYPDPEIRDNAVDDDAIGMRTLNEEAAAPSELTATLGGWIRIFASVLRGITGKTSILTAPAITLEQTKAHTETKGGAAIGHVKDGGDIDIDNDGAMWISDATIDLANLTFVPELAANRNVANGYAGLDANSKISANQLPPVAISNTFVVGSSATMLALTVETGDVAVRTDENKTYILRGDNPAVLSDWQQLLFPAGVVSIIAGNGLVGGTITSTGTIAIDVDGTTIEIASNKVRVKDGGIGTAKIATEAVTGGGFGSGSKIAQATIVPANISRTAISAGKAIISDGFSSSAVWGNPTASAIILPYNDTLNSNSDLLSITNSGAGRAINGNANGAGDAVRGNNTSTGKAGMFIQTGTGGDALWGQINNTASPKDAIHGESNGDGNSLILVCKTTVASTVTARNFVIGQDSNGNRKWRIDNIGKAFFNGGSQVGGADVAEAVPVAGSKSSYTTGTVMQMNTAVDRTYKKAGVGGAYLVSGVVVADDAANLLLGVPEYGMNGDPENGGADERVAMAIIGRVLVNISDSAGGIQRGDWIVLSNTDVGVGIYGGSGSSAPPAAAFARAEELWSLGNGIGQIQCLLRQI